MAELPRTTVLIRQLANGDRAGDDALFSAVYEQIHAIAVRQLAGERVGHTLQPTALVHEAFIRLVDGAAVDCRDRAHFMALAAQVIRRLLIDHARRRLAAKRGGGVPVRQLDGESAPMGDADLMALDDALRRLQDVHPRQARVVEVRFFGGLTFEEIADLLGLSVTTARADWYFARAWLRRELGS